MEIQSNPTRGQEKDNYPLLYTPSHTSSSSSSSSSSSNGVVPHPLTPKPVSTTDPLNYNNATTFIQADTSSFKHVVQMLTGSSLAAKQPKHASDPPRAVIPPAWTGPKRPAFKLYERRNSSKNLKISPLLPGIQTGSVSARMTEILSPSILDLPSLVLSPVTPLIPDPFNRIGTGPSPELNPGAGAEEERAIAEKGFYLHPSPRTTPRDTEPRLLPLFPLTSPRVSGSS